MGSFSVFNNRFYLIQISISTMLFFSGGILNEAWYIHVVYCLGNGFFRLTPIFPNNCFYKSLSADVNCMCYNYKLFLRSMVNHMKFMSRQCPPYFQQHIHIHLLLADGFIRRHKYLHCISFIILIMQIIVGGIQAFDELATQMDWSWISRVLT